jgi:hypothetical protein
MPSYPLVPRNGLLPASASRQLSRQLNLMHAQALAARHADQLAIERAVECTERGMVGIARISLREAALSGTAPAAAARLRAAADNGSAVVISRIIESGF